MYEEYFTEMQSSASETLRTITKAKFGRVTFDCFHAKTFECNNGVKTDLKVRCEHGGKLDHTKHDGSIELKPIFDGILCHACVKCVLYDSKDNDDFEGIGKSVYIILWRNNIRSIQDLLKLTEMQILELRGMGVTRLVELREFLATKNIALKR